MITDYFEGARSLATGNLSPSSEQQLVNCDKVDSGCHGERMNYAFASAEENAMCTETGCGYTVTEGTCKASCYIAGIIQGSVT